MRKLFAKVQTAIRRFQSFQSFQNSLSDYHKEQQARRERAKSLLASVSPEGRFRFNDEVLINLLDAGWHEGRVWDHGQLSAFENRFQSIPPPTADDVLREFGGLEVGLTGRTIAIGQINSSL